MDCPICKGNGELEHIRAVGKPQQNEGNGQAVVQGRPSWPYTCSTCGGSGYLEAAY
jgi:DnaJ-class molecular chaperone